MDISSRFALIHHGGSRLLIFVILSAIAVNITSSHAFADRVYLRESKTGNVAQVLEEYPDAIVIKFPKSEIRRIETDEKPPYQNYVTSQSQVIWVDDGDSIILRLPKKSIFSGNLEDLEKAASGELVSKTEQETASKQETSDRIIQGKVFYRGDPLSDCKVRIVRIPNSIKLFSILSAKEEIKKESVFESVTDFYGIYEFHNIPYGEYILYWKPKGNSSWIRRLSENPDIVLVPGHPVYDKDIEAKVKTIN